MRGKTGDVIDYVPMASGNVAVFLANKRAGTIAWYNYLGGENYRWRYVPAGKGIDDGGEIFDTLAEVKASLEES